MLLTELASALLDAGRYREIGVLGAVELARKADESAAMVAGL
jgi:hypothetical protein